MKNIINFTLFQLLWFGCVLGAAHEFILPSIVIFIVMLITHLVPKFNAELDLTLVLCCFFFGFVLDSFLAYFNFIDYRFNAGLSQVAPFWILFLWIGFALTLNNSMSWLMKKPKVGSFFIVIGAPLSYFSAEKLGAIKINEQPITFILISIMWFVVYHILIALHNWKKNMRVLSND